jgi:hypothetical protein
VQFDSSDPWHKHVVMADTSKEMTFLLPPEVLTGSLVNVYSTTQNRISGSSQQVTQEYDAIDAKIYTLTAPADRLIRILPTGTGEAARIYKISYMTKPFFS